MQIKLNARASGGDLADHVPRTHAPIVRLWQGLFRLLQSFAEHPRLNVSTLLLVARQLESLARTCAIVIANSLLNLFLLHSWPLL
jgi:hypothetical protein